MKKVLMLCLASLLSLAVPEVAVASLTIDIPISADTFISSNYPTTNYNNLENLTVSGTTSSLGYSKALINFDLSSMNIPAGYVADISYAGVFMFMKDITPDNSPMNYALRACTQSWNQNTVTWNSMSSGTYLSSASLQMNSWMSWEFNLETLENWVNGKQPYYGFLITPHPGNDISGANSFYQMEYFSHLNLHGNPYQEIPNYLHIEYTLQPAPVPIPGAVWLLGSGLIGLIGIRKKLKK